MRLLRLLPAVPLLLSACMYDHTNSDVEDRPEIDIGSGATIIPPGQSPGMPRRAGGSGSSASSGEPAGSDTALLGGAGGAASRNTETRNVPLGPLATVFGYPFWIFGKSLNQKANDAAERRDSGQPEPEGQTEEERTATPDDLERRRLARENEQILEMLRSQRKQAAEVAKTNDAPPSIGDELAALERTLGMRPVKPSSPTVPAGPRPSDVVDRNADGRPDLWVYEEDDSRRREVTDENDDGRPDRQVTYGADGEMERSEEDTDGDGRYESTTVFEAGEPLRKRVDTDADGQVDTWSFYESGELSRHEVDRDGDGFRDLVLLYESGQLTREEEDKNADGRPDLVVQYEQGQPKQRDEDLNYDGVPDVQSYYENGKLVRREVHSLELLERLPES